mgnify:CR=1 FL=1
MWDIQLFKLNFDDREVKAVSEVVEDGWLTMGEKTSEFEEKFSLFLGSETYCAAVANCTAALHMSLLALDIQRNDEVIIPALTFIADANVVNIVGAKVVLADSTSLNNWNVNLDSIKNVVTKNTKAIIVVHFAGYPIEDISEIRDFCIDQDIKLIEDVAHAPGASVNGQKCGTFGDASCFSFFSNKNLSIGEGGLVASNDEHIYKKLKYLRSHGMTSLTLDRHKGRSITYDVEQPGLNYRMDEMRASIGLVQLDKLKEGNKKRGILTNRYRANLKGSSIEIPFKYKNANLRSAFHIMPVLIPSKCNRAKVINYLKDKRIQSSIHYPPFWDFNAYSNQFAAKNFPIAADICNRELTLPLFPSMTLDQVDHVCEVLLDACNE